MRKIIAIGGEPATGKSTIMKSFLSRVTDWENVMPEKLVPAMYSKEHDLYVLGTYAEGEMFGGTDRMSMAVQPMATKFVQECKSNILFEGDRLFNQSFLELLADLPDTELEIIYIIANPNVIHDRHVSRNDSQSEKFIKGRVTKYENLKSNFILMGYSKTFVNETEEHLKTVVNHLAEKLYTK